MLRRLEVFMIAAVFILLTAIILIINGKEREHEFHDHRDIIQKANLNGAAHAIEMHMLDKQRDARLFANEYSKLILHLARFSRDTSASNELKAIMADRFPDFFTFTLTDAQAVPMLMDIESFVGEACQVDLKNFSKSIQSNNKQHRNKVFIHPQPFHYHYDIMTPIGVSGSQPRIFFMSFYPTRIIETLKTHEVPGYSLILVRQSDPELIEVTSQGVRDRINRDIRLTKSEMKRVNAFRDIVGTDWRLINLADPEFERQYVRGIWSEAIIILLIVIIALIILIFVLMRTAAKRS